MNELLKLGLAKKLIDLDDEQKNITYVRQNKRLRFTDPEEKVRAYAYLSLVFDYGYDADQIDIEVTVEHRVPTIFSDIVVYADKSLKKPLIVVECKREEASQGELDQAVEQGFGYANSMDADWVWMTSGLRNDYFIRDRSAPKERVKNRRSDIPRCGEKDAARFKFVKGGREGFELKTVEENELTRIFKQAHDALWAGGKRNPAEAFDELDKLIFCKIWDERANRKVGEPYDFQVFSDDKGDALKARIHNLYLEGRKKDAEVFKEDIRLSNAELQTVVGYLAATNLSKTDLDSKGRAFETFMSDFFRGDFGQYFTPRKIVQFIVDTLPIHNESKVLDTSCGSGGFLLHALDKVRKQADQKAREGYFDPTTPEGYKEHFDFWHDFAEHNLFGIEISEGIARTAKMNMIIHDDGHTNVIAFDGLESIETMREKTKNRGFKEEGFDFIITNPPFGSKVKFAEKRYLENYSLGKKGVDWIDAKLNNINLNRETIRDQQTTEVLFIEQCHRFLKPGGYLAMVIPDSILTNSSMQYVRDWIEVHWRIVAVVSLPQFAFAANGAGVKSSVLFLKKYSEKTTAAIEKIKAQAQDDLFGKKSQGQALESLILEKKHRLKIGDQTVQDIENSLVSKLETMKAQGTLTAALTKTLKSEAKAAIKAHMATEAYQTWQQATSDDYNERIINLRVALEDEYLARVKNQVKDYPIFMSIAEDIGYDAANRPTQNNQLPEISRYLKMFLTDPEQLINGVEKSRSIIGERCLVNNSNNIFIKSSQHLTGFRFDARVHSCDFWFETNAFPLVPLRKLASINPSTNFDNLNDDDLVSFVPMEAVDDEYGEINARMERPVSERTGFTRFQEGDLIFAKITPCMENGKSAVARGLINGRGLGSTEFHVIRTNPLLLNVDYLHALLRLPRVRTAATLFFGGSAGHQRVDVSFLRNLEIPLPSIYEQEKIVNAILKEKNEAKTLQQLAKNKLKNSLLAISDYVEK